MDAILDDEMLLKIEGSEKFMLKLSEEVLMEEREEGRIEGKLEGRMEGIMTTARNMLKMNLSIDMITLATGLTNEEIEQLTTISEQLIPDK